MVMVICLLNKISRIRQRLDKAVGFSGLICPIVRPHADGKLCWRITTLPMLLKKFWGKTGALLVRGLLAGDRQVVR